MFLSFLITVSLSVGDARFVTLEHKTSLKSRGIFVAIAKNTLYGSKYAFFFYAKNH